MSRIGKLPVPVPKGVTVKLQGSHLAMKGPKGELAQNFDSGVLIALENDELVVTRRDDSRRSRGVHGLTRKLISNMVTGVTTGFTRTLEINGVGYRADAKPGLVTLMLGYSHPIVFQLPKGVTAKVDKQTVVTLEGSDKQILGEVAAMIRDLRPPEPYKGKGVKYAEETIRRKAGKAAGSA